MKYFQQYRPWRLIALLLLLFAALPAQALEQMQNASFTSLTTGWNIPPVSMGGLQTLSPPVCDASNGSDTVGSIKFFGARKNGTGPGTGSGVATLDQDFLSGKTLSSAANAEINFVYKTQAAFTTAITLYVGILAKVSNFATPVFNATEAWSANGGTPWTTAKSPSWTATLAANTTYNLQLECDINIPKSGRVRFENSISIWFDRVSFNISPQGLTATETELGKLALSWDPSTCPGANVPQLDSYTIYGSSTANLKATDSWGIPLQSITQPTTSWTDDPASDTLYYCVSDVDTSGTESPKSVQSTFQRTLKISKVEINPSETKRVTRGHCHSNKVNVTIDNVSNSDVSFQGASLTFSLGTYSLVSCKSPAIGSTINAHTSIIATFDVTVASDSDIGSVGSIDATASGTVIADGRKVGSCHSYGATASWDIENAGQLNGAFALGPTPVEVGETVTATFTVSNLVSSSSSLTGTTPSTPASTGGSSGNLSSKTGPTPPSSTISSGSSIDFVWTYQATEPSVVNGSFSMAVSATGSDSNSNIATSTSAVSNAIFISSHSLQITEVKVNQEKVTRGHPCPTTVDVTFYNPGNSPASFTGASLTFSLGTYLMTLASPTEALNLDTHTGMTANFNVTVASDSGTGMDTLDATASGSWYRERDNATYTIGDVGADKTATWTIQYAGQLKSQFTFPETVFVGENATASFSVWNPVSDSSSLMNTTPIASLPATEEGSLGNISYVSGPSPTSIAEISNSSPGPGTFTWTYLATRHSGTGGYALNATVTGSDKNSNLATTTTAVTNSLTILGPFLEFAPDIVDFGSMFCNEYKAVTGCTVNNTGNYEATKVATEATDPEAIPPCFSALLFNPATTFSIPAAGSQEMSFALSIPYNTSEGDHIATFTIFEDVSTMKPYVYDEFAIKVHVNATKLLVVTEKVIDFGTSVPLSSTAQDTVLAFNGGNTDLINLSFAQDDASKAAASLTASSITFTPAVAASLPWQGSTSLSVNIRATVDEKQDEGYYISTYTVFADDDSDGTIDPGEASDTFQVKIHVDTAGIEAIPDPLEIGTSTPTFSISKLFSVKNRGASPLSSLALLPNQEDFTRSGGGGAITADNLSVTLPASIEPGASENATMTVQVPAGTPAGEYTCHRKVYDTTGPFDWFHVKINVATYAHLEIIPTNVTASAVAGGDTITAVEISVLNTGNVPLDAITKGFISGNPTMGTDSIPGPSGITFSPLTLLPGEYGTSTISIDPIYFDTPLGPYVGDQQLTFDYSEGTSKWHSGDSFTLTFVIRPPGAEKASTFQKLASSSFAASPSGNRFILSGWVCPGTGTAALGFYRADRNGNDAGYDGITIASTSAISRFSSLGSNMIVDAGITDSRIVNNASFPADTLTWYRVYAVFDYTFEPTAASTAWIILQNQSPPTASHAVWFDGVQLEKAVTPGQKRPTPFDVQRKIVTPNPTESLDGGKSYYEW